MDTRPVLGVRGEELACRVFRRRGFEVVERNYRCRAGEIDLIAAGMFITPERCEQIAFSEPSYGIPQAFLVKEGNPLNLKTYDDVAKNEDARLAVMAGAVEKGYAEAAGVDPEQRAGRGVGAALAHRLEVAVAVLLVDRAAGEHVRALHELRLHVAAEHEGLEPVLLAVPHDDDRRRVADGYHRSSISRPRTS